MKHVSFHNKSKKKLLLTLLGFFILFVLAVFTGFYIRNTKEVDVKETEASANDYAKYPLDLTMTPSVIPQGKTYSIEVNYKDGSPYNGYLDVKSVFCNSDTNQCTAYPVTKWDVYVRNGKGEVETDSNIPVGHYIASIKPVGENQPFSTEKLISVEDKEVYKSSLSSYNTQDNINYPIPKPVPGAYAIYKNQYLDYSNTDSSGKPQRFFTGFTKIEYEDDICPGEAGVGTNSTIMRISKTTPTSYWNPAYWENPKSNDHPFGKSNRIDVLRFCIVEEDSLNWKATAHIKYTYDKLVDHSGSLRFSDYTTIPTHPDSEDQKLLGRLGKQKIYYVDPTGWKSKPTNTYEGGVAKHSSYSMEKYFYSLVPAKLLPSELSNEFTIIGNKMIGWGRDPADVSTYNLVTTWHMAARKSQRPDLGGLYQIRYSEDQHFYGFVDTKFKTLGLGKLIEDWDLDAVGLPISIRQYPMKINNCMLKNNCEDPNNRKDGIIIERFKKYVPDPSKPLEINFGNNASGAPILLQNVNKDKSFIDLHVYTESGPYDGFLQVEVAVWTGIGMAYREGFIFNLEGYPIYISDGYVKIPTSILKGSNYPVIGDNKLVFRVRQQLLNRNISADQLLTDIYQPNNSDQQYSKPVTIIWE
ncbi:hypothetical protein GF362_03755 [Candidatus Dojkabacteria bacterium]|nr:hypothetical protein [Candidatus Dojkabacteria bacterium]